jgi:DNA-binding XRE family transcriptional regulator
MHPHEDGVSGSPGRSYDSLSADPPRKWHLTSSLFNIEGRYHSFQTIVSILQSVDGEPRYGSNSAFDQRGTVNELQRQFGRVLRRRRLAASMSQEALSERAGLHRTYVGLLEKGVRMPSILVARQIALALGTTMVDLLGEVEREPATEEVTPQTD